ncbi:response regulator [[Brevibacterium] frigoritolerans]|nr:response regulator [Peribacillus frigoritolerans]
MYPRILICDDMVYSRAMLKNIIDQVGQYIIVEAENGEELLKKVKENKEKKREFEFIFLDLEMKRENGMDYLLKLREIEPLVEVVLCGGFRLTDENIAKGMELGVKRFVPKPYKVNDVSMVLNRH